MRAEERTVGEQMTERERRHVDCVIMLRSIYRCVSVTPTEEEKEEKKK